MVGGGHDEEFEDLEDTCAGESVDACDEEVEELGDTRGGELEELDDTPRDGESELRAYLLHIYDGELEELDDTPRDGESEFEQLDDTALDDSEFEDLESECEEPPLQKPKYTGEFEQMVDTALDDLEFEELGGACEEPTLKKPKCTKAKTHIYQMPKPGMTSSQRASLCGISSNMFRRLVRIGMPLLMFNMLWLQVVTLGPPERSVWMTQYSSES